MLGVFNFKSPDFFPGMILNTFDFGTKLVTEKSISFQNLGKTQKATTSPRNHVFLEAFGDFNVRREKQQIPNLLNFLPKLPLFTTLPQRLEPGKERSEH